jgi:hypothetical protein
MAASESPRQRRAKLACEQRCSAEGATPAEGWEDWGRERGVGAVGASLRPQTTWRSLPVATS